MCGPRLSKERRGRRARCAGAPAAAGDSPRRSARWPARVRNARAGTDPSNRPSAGRPCRFLSQRRRACSRSARGSASADAPGPAMTPSWKPRTARAPTVALSLVGSQAERDARGKRHPLGQAPHHTQRHQPERSPGLAPGAVRARPFGIAHRACLPTGSRLVRRRKTQLEQRERGPGRPFQRLRSRLLELPDRRGWQLEPVVRHGGPGSRACARNSRLRSAISRRTAWFSRLPWWPRPAWGVVGFDSDMI